MSLVDASDEPKWTLTAHIELNIEHEQKNRFGFSNFT